MGSGPITVLRILVPETVIHDQTILRFCRTQSSSSSYANAVLMDSGLQKPFSSFIIIPTRSQEPMGKRVQKLVLLVPDFGTALLVTGYVKRDS